MTTVLSRLSPVEIGSAFERHSLLFLNHHLHMSLRRVGGAGDEGIDLKGWWYVPSTAQRIDSTSRKALDVQESLVLGPSESGLEKGKRTGKHKGLDKGKGKEVEKEVVEVESPADWMGGFGEDLSTGVAHKRVRVVAQCKAERAKINGRAVRELEGVMGHLYGREALRGPHQFSSSGKPLDRPPPPSVAVLLSQSGFSQQAMIRAWRSPSPMMLVHLPGGRPRGESPTSDSETEGDDGALGGGDGAGRAGLGGGGGEIMVEGAWWNPSLAGKRGLFGGLLELRREILDSSGRNGVMGEAEVRAQYRVWYEGKRMPRLGPALQDEVD